MKISVVIPVYKKSDMLMRHLRHNVPFLKDYEIIVVDDASDEDITTKIHAEFPQIHVYENGRNLGFAPSVNRGIREAQGDYIMLLNSDVKLMQPFTSSDFDVFEKDPALFAVSFMQKERDGSFIGKNRLFFEDGFPHHDISDNLDKGLNGWAEGGSCIIRMQYLQELGGFLDIYAPFYWEDNDLSYRAYSRGWYVLFDPRFIVEHHHESTVSAFYTKKQVRTIAYRNQLLFTWINITESSFFMAHLLLLPKHLLKAVIRWDMQFLKGCVAALCMLPQVFGFRKNKKSHQVISDSEVLTKISS